MRTLFNEPSTVALEDSSAAEKGKKFAFLGGTVNGSNWRDILIPLLTIGYFNPVVADWTEEHAIRENQAKASANVNLYVITPKQHGLYVPFELATTACESRNNPNMKVVAVFLKEDGGDVFTDHQLASITQIRELLHKNPEVEIFDNLESTARFLNSYLADSPSGSNGNAN